VDHGLELLGIPPCDLQKLHLAGKELSSEAVQHQRNELIHDGERSAKLVRNVGEELVLEVHLLPVTLLDLERKTVALEGIAHRAKDAVAIEPPLDEIVLRSVLKSMKSELLVVPARHDDDRGATSTPRSPHGVESVHVGQGEVEEHQVEGMPAEKIESVGETLDVSEMDAPVSERVLEKEGVGRIVLDEEDADALLHVLRSFPGSEGCGQGGQVQPERGDPVHHGHQLLEVERLAYVAVGVEPVALPNVPFGRRGREDDDRSALEIRVLLELLEDLGSCPARQVEIEEDEVGSRKVPVTESPNGLLAVPGEEDLVATPAFLEGELQQTSVCRIVLDE
jgi:hypothetical protein